jgi:hypothetical protein
MSDVDFPSVFSDTVRKAHRDHKCCECERIIKPGDKYHLFKGCWDGKWDEYKTCLECDGIRAELRSLYRSDECPAFGELFEWVHEAGIEFPAGINNERP